MSETRSEIRRLIEATNKYRLESENTEGANAYAFHAHHLLLNQPVFLKVCYSDVNEDLLHEPHLLVEATRTDESDSNLVRVYDAQRLDAEWVLVAMENVEGGSILSRLGSGPLSLNEAVRAAIGILRGLAQLHRALLVHRDIKPANVLLSTRHGRIWPKIADFGSVARLADSKASVTASRQSALYVPPEGWKNPSRYDIRSDIYQAGLVLFEMVHGPLPNSDAAYFDQSARREFKKLKRLANGDQSFEMDQILKRALARAAARGGVTKFGKKQPYVSNPLARIVNKAVALDPTKRYQSPSDMIGALAALQLPNWQPTPGCLQYVALGWAGWDWEVRQNTRENRHWEVCRRRPGKTSFRRWKPSENERSACQLVTQADT